MAGGARRMMGRAASRMRAALAILMLVLAAAPSARAGEGLTLRSALHDGFGRIVFDWHQPTAFEARQAGRELVIRFSRPLDAEVASLKTSLAPYIAAATLEPDRQTLRLALTAPYPHRAFPEAKMVILDILAPAADAPETAPAPTQAANGAKERPALPVRIGAHEGFERIVFDWPQPVVYRIAREGERLTLHFERAAKLDRDALARRLPENIALASVNQGADELGIEFRIAAEALTRDFTNGASVVLDVYRQPPGTPPAPISLAAATPEGTDAAPGEGNEAKANPEGEAGAVEPPAETAAAGTEGKEGKDAATLPAAMPAPADTETVALSLRPHEAGSRLRFAWERPASAAVFQRGTLLWVVFDQEAAVALPDLDSPFLTSAGLLDVAAAEGMPATVVWFELAAPVGIRVERAGTEWIVDLAPSPATPARAVSVRIDDDAPRGARLFIPEAEAGPVLRLTDPLAGDPLLVVPLSRPGRGVAPARRYAEFELLDTAQGIAVRPLSDSLRVEGLRGGIAISSLSGLKISPLVPGGAAPAGDAGARPEPARLLPLETWQVGEAVAQAETRERLLRSLALADETYLSDARFNLAAFYVANDFAADALGVLEAIAREDPDAAASARFLALRGVALVRLERYAAAEADLLSPALDADPDIALWRALAATGRRDWPRAAELFRRADLAFYTLPAPWRGPIEMAAARVDIEMADAARAGFRLAQAAKAGYPPLLQGRYDYLGGRIEQLLGNDEEALKAWDTVIAGDWGLARAEALFARTLHDLEHETITEAEAIEAFESLRFAWRGDAFERDLLHRLGVLYIGRGEYANGLDTWRTAMVQFADDPAAEVIRAEMERVFREVYELSLQDIVSPLDAVAIFFEFRELTPEGNEGDMMIGALAERLVDMDLLPRAAALLEAQVKQRLSGIEKMRVGARLAVVRLLDGDAAGALRAIAISDVQSLRRPAALAEERRLLEARALFGLGRSAEALDLLAGHSGREALHLAADIHWAAGDWAAVCRALGRLYTPARADDGALAENDEVYLMKYAVALSLIQDRQELERIQRAYGEALRAGPYGAAFDALATDDVPGALPFRDFIAAAADIGPIESLLASYRERIEADGLSSLN